MALGGFYYVITNPWHSSYTLRSIHSSYVHLPADQIIEHSVAANEFCDDDEREFPLTGRLFQHTQLAAWKEMTMKPHPRTKFMFSL